MLSEGGYEKDLERFSEEVSEFIGMPVRFGSFEDAFRFLTKQGKLVVVIDEFPYLIEAYRPIVSVFQEIVDLIIKDSQVTLILSGSSVGG